jgi:Subtilase family
MISPDNRFFPQQWGLKLIKVQQAWELLQKGNLTVMPALNGTATEKAFGSSDIVITIVDNGVETINNVSVHKSFAGTTTNNAKLINNIATVNNSEYNITDKLLGNHGMNTSGVSLAKAKVSGITAYDGSGIVGVAPNCRFYSLATNLPIYFMVGYLFELAGLDFILPTPDPGFNFTKNYLESLDFAYNSPSDTLNTTTTIKKNKNNNGVRLDLSLNSFLNNVYSDIFSLSLASPSATGSLNEDYSKAFFNEITFFGRKGRGCVFVIGAGNNGFDIEPSPNQFLNEMASSNKPIIVGAVSVDNSYNWIAGSPPANTKKSSYSNYGNRIDICAPGGGGATIGQEKNLIYTTAVKGGGNLLVDSPLKLTLKTKVNAVELTPPNPDFYDYVVLEFDNINGVFPGQGIVLGNFNNISSYELYSVDQIFPSLNRFDIRGMKKTIYAGLIDATTAGSKTVFEFVPLFTKISSARSNNIIKVESVNGAYPYTTDEIFIGSLGDSSSGHTRKIRTINSTTNEITLTSSIASNIGDYVVFPRKTASLSGTIPATGNVVNAIIVDNITGFFVGGLVDIHDSTGTISSSISAIDIATRQLTLQLGIPRPNNPATVLSAGFGDITSDFLGTSAATPFVSGVAALVLSANSNLSAAEVKHIIKQSAGPVDTTGVSPYAANTDGYYHSPYYGTGLLDAEAAVALALKWHTSPTVQKPTLVIADKLSGGLAGAIIPVPTGEAVDSPDIWVSTLANSNTTPLPPFNQIITSEIKYYINIRVRNTGNRQSFKECDVRVFVAFTDEENPKFPFPTSWYDQTDVKLLAVKEIPIIAAGGETIIQIEWKNIAAFWDANNPLPVGVVGGKRKRAYILAHIAPFDGLDTEVMRDNIRNNKQLTCKELIVTHNGVSDRTAYIPGNQLNITVGSQIVAKSFDLTMENVPSADLTALKIRATKKNRQNGALDSVLYKKTGNSWALESGAVDWITFQTPTETDAVHANYKNAVFPHTLNVNDAEEEIKLQIV